MRREKLLNEFLEVNRAEVAAVAKRRAAARECRALRERRFALVALLEGQKKGPARRRRGVKQSNDTFLPSSVSVKSKTAKGGAR